MLVPPFDGLAPPPTTGPGSAPVSFVWVVERRRALPRVFFMSNLQIYDSWTVLLTGESVCKSFARPLSRIRWWSLSVICAFVMD